MKKLLIVFILLFSVANTYSIDFTENELIKLEGTISLSDYYGPPNYGESPQTDQIERYYILSFDDDTELYDQTSLEKYKIKEIQIIYNKNTEKTLTQIIDFSQFIGKKISIKGYLYKAETGHHHTQLIFIVEQDIRNLLYLENRNFWPKQNTLEISKIGSVNNYCIYLTKLISETSKRMTQRLVIFDQLNNYLGHFYGIDSTNISIDNKIIVFNDIEKQFGNTIDLSHGIPDKIYYNGEVVEFNK
jgi:hypothetical protein